MSTNQLHWSGLPGDPSSRGRRSPLEMACDVLRVISEGPTRPTHILHMANMSWRVLSLHLDHLHSRGLVEKFDRGGMRVEYRLTQKGRSILELYEGLVLGISGYANVYPAKETFPLVERIVTNSAQRRAWNW